jgi:phosphoribosylformimino-5-aminoimidazole carboxamide ribotide isomerase
MERFPNLELIASGGIASMKDIHELNEMDIPGVITGKAIYEGRIKLEEISRFLR